MGDNSFYPAEGSEGFIPVVHPLDQECDPDVDDGVEDKSEKEVTVQALEEAQRRVE